MVCWCWIKFSMDEILFIVVLEMVVEIDVVVVATVYFFVTCDLCIDGLIFYEYLMLVMLVYDFVFVMEM